MFTPPASPTHSPRAPDSYLTFTPEKESRSPLSSPGSATKKIRTLMLSSPPAKENEPSNRKGGFFATPTSSPSPSPSKGATPTSAPSSAPGSAGKSASPSDFASIGRDPFQRKPNTTTRKRLFADAEGEHEHRLQSVGKDDILKIRFSQNSILEETSDGLTLKQMITNMTRDGWDNNRSQAITCVRMADGRLTSLDNRRLFAAKKVARVRADFRVPILVVNHLADASSKYTVSINQELRSKTITKLDTFKPDSWGYCVYARMRLFAKDVSADLLGYEKFPKVRQL